MSEPTFTPGPWRAEQDALGHWAILWPHSTKRAVARKVYSEDDARLIAAAPDLYEALAAYRKAQRRMLEQWSECDERARQNLWVDLHRCQLAADAALAKAEGL
jgi:hypothetical protein